MAAGSEEGESELAGTGMWVLNVDDGLDSGWVSDGLMGNCSSFPKEQPRRKRPQFGFADEEAVSRGRSSMSRMCFLLFVPGAGSRSASPPFPPFNSDVTAQKCFVVSEFKSLSWALAGLPP